MSTKRVRSCNHTFSYDAKNNLISRTDAAGKISQANDTVSGAIQMGYDTLDRLIQEITNQGVVGYNYDVIGRRTSMMVNGQTPVNYGYDNASRLLSVGQGSLGVNLGYDAAGRRTGMGYSNGVATSYRYDPASRLTDIAHQASSLIESLAYTYDAAGNRISLNRANGTATSLPSAVQAAYDAANQMMQFNANTLSYDANGNLMSDGTKTYIWDARNRLVGITGPGLSASFVYDALGRRVSKTIDGATTEYLYDGNDIVAEINGGVVTTTYLRSLNIDEPFVRQSSTTEFYHTDALGSTLALTDQTGSVQATYQYDPFGNTTITGTSSSPFMYTGRENDGTGVYYYRARYYSSKMQRFLNEDPIGFSGGDVNIYAYVKNNPIRYFDPWGLGQWGRRPLNGVPVMTELLSHEQYWFDDNTNIGFFDDGQVREDIGHSRAEYETFGDIYNDELLRDVIKDIDRGGDYCLLFNNCHDWADRVREEYERRNRNPCMILSGRKPHAC